MSKYRVRRVDVNPPGPNASLLVTERVVETTGVDAAELAADHQAAFGQYGDPDSVVTTTAIDASGPPVASTTLELCTPAEAPDFPTVPLATATTEQIVAELKDRGYYGVELRS